MLIVNGQENVCQLKPNGNLLPEVVFNKRYIPGVTKKLMKKNFIATIFKEISPTKMKLVMVLLAQPQ